MNENTTRQLWWHAYGHVVPDGFDFAGEWYMAVAERSDRAPDDYVRGVKLGPSEAPYLASWDHEPTDADKRFVTPAEHRRGRRAVEVPDVD